MAHRIKKAALRWSQEQLENLSSRLEADNLGQLLTAAALVGSHEHRDAIEWFQPPPEQTALEWIEMTVALTFRPETGLVLKSQIERNDLSAAQELLRNRSPEQQRALQCLALKALEGNLRWKVEPPFDTP